MQTLEKGGCSAWVLGIRVTNMNANSSASATKCYWEFGQFHVQWEVRYKFRNKCRKGFQLVDSSDCGFSLQATIINFKKSVTPIWHYRVKKIYFYRKSAFCFKQLKIGSMLKTWLEKKWYLFRIFPIFSKFLQINYKTWLNTGLQIF